ncbi:MAG: hypothetical protein A2428_04750 [Bdellovibrionales bacterium RIFOXYC1_FULL_54_43]|nr:MAG: hypothetical protein A2428_04750 [Bdellovibrionales bacterium RIFOXYC1_FULL_54_43]OFZ83901.1 MAG: hypothetical protein A2603_09120 [Bdellovibrionales bacterium RIFOXYD1_FULL_55_31]
MPRKKPDPAIKNFGLFSIIITDVLGYTGAGIAIGYFVSRKWGAPLWVLAITTIAGFTLGMFRVYQISKKDGSN